MKTAAIIIAASAALAAAQVTYVNGTFVCASPNANYCAGDSLGTDIIIRCNNGTGQPGRCSDNLDGEPPLGDNPALCYQSTNTSGDAACEKNCVVYASSAFTLPASECTPYYTATTSTSSTTGPPSGSVSTTCTTSTSSVSVSPPCTTSTSSVSPPCTTSTSSVPTTITTTCSSLSGGNGTYITTSTNTPVGPTTTTTSTPITVPTAGASANQIGGALAFVGLVAAYFL